MNNKDLEQKAIRKKYSPQFKDQTLERSDKDGIPQVAKDLGLAEALLYSWRHLVRLKQRLVLCVKSWV